ncbi:hypothetical protein GN956_G25150 [Arapaima gigas]
MSHVFPFPEHLCLTITQGGEEKRKGPRLPKLRPRTVWRKGFVGRPRSRRTLSTSRMDESTFETFEEEFCPSGKQEPPVKSIRHTHRPDPQSSKKMREEPPRLTQKERSCKGGAAPLHRTISLQTLTQIEAPLEWITLNRCLVLAITLVLIGSSFQRLCEVLEGLGQKVETQSPEIQSTDLRDISLELDSQLEQIESSLWDNWFLNLILDDDADNNEDSEEEEEEENSRWVAEQKSDHGRLGALKYMKPTKNLHIEKKETRGQQRMARRKMEDLSEMKEHRMRKNIRRKKSEDDEALGEDEEASPRRKRQSIEAEKRQKLKKQQSDVKKLPIRGHRHHL